MKRILLLICCLGMLCVARGQTRLHYWFDGLDGTKVTIPMAETNRLSTQLDVADLAEGVHSLYLMAEDAEGKLGSPVQRTFIRSMSFDENLYYRCWFDNDEMTAQTGELADGAIMLDVANLSDGLHTVFVQAYGNFVTSPQSYQFLKVPNVVGNEELTYICLIDDQLFTQQTVPGTQEVIHLDMDVAPLSQGVHKLQIMLATESGAVTGAYTSYFYRAILQTEITEARLVYMIDGKEQPAASTASATNGILHYDLDVSSLSNGLHCISYALVGSNGVYDTGTTQWFYKIPIGGEGLVSYEYWLNDDEANMHHVDLAEHVSAYHLVSLLPVDEVPVRSSLFQFAFKNDTIPVAYAKNDFHICFWESEGSYASANAQYVDERACDTVHADTLKATNIINAPKKDTIYWYCVQAKAGDSLSIKTNKACDLHIFSPSAEEVYTADATQSVAWGGCHANEKGLYYIALHDYKADSLPSITLYSQHIDRYALFSHYPENVGNTIGQRFTLSLYGNGFDKLKLATLSRNREVLSMDTILYYDRTHASLLFIIDKDTYPNGEYDLTLYFQDETEVEEYISQEEAIVFTEAIWGNVNVSIESFNRVELYFPIAIHIANKGNVTYSNVPFNIAWTNPEEIKKIRFANFYVSVNEKNDSAGYSFVVTTDNLLNNKEYGAMMFFYVPELGPYETKTYNLEILADGGTEFSMFAWVDDKEHLVEYVLSQQFIQQKKNNILVPAKDPPPRTDNYGRNMIEMGDRAEGALSHGPHPMDYAGTVASNAIKAGVAIGSSINMMGRMHGEAYISAYGVDPETADMIRNAYADLYPHVSTPDDFGDDLGEYMRLQGGCAENPTPNPGHRHHMRVPSPYDPNEIRGYLSESGSKYISSDVESIGYTIEFENDSVLATAAAHTIIVRDTLDATRFDLASFATTEITIGDRKMKWETPHGGIQTMDMRTRMNVIAQVQLDYSDQTGIAQWTITSLDPMTMEPITDADLGVLPVNFDGNGMGTISYRINLKNRFDDGTQIANRASIIFDNNQPILTPVWINTVDAVSPTSAIVKTDLVSDSVTFRLNTADNRSGIWRRDVYARVNAEDEWQIAAQSHTDTAVVKLTDGWRQFYVLAVDSAGNIEAKTPNPEFSLVLDTYLITFYDEDGTTILDAREWDYGMIPSCEIPRKEADQLYWYEFDQWIPALAPVTAETAYTASYKALPLITTGLQNLSEQDPSAQKLLRDGLLLILRGDKTYTVTGQEVR